MKIKIAHYLFLLTIAFFSSSSCKQKNDLLDKLLAGNVNEYTIPNLPSLRGVDVLDDKVVWVSGSKGTFARTVDAGQTWHVGKINNDTLLDFRDIHAFSDVSAIAISAGSPAKIYKTTDGGLTWTLKYENRDSSIFFNSFDFCDEKQGIACSDPIHGKFLFIKTKNGGESWDTIDNKILPKPLIPEGGFAASGTSVVYTDDGIILYGTGGAEARIIRSSYFGESWESIKTPIKAGDSSYGIYSIERIDPTTFIIAGGCWEKPNEAIGNVAISIDCGETWSLTKSFPSGFESCIKYAPRSKGLIACGTNGVDISVNMGKTWKKTLLQGYNSMDLSLNEDLLVFVDSKGRIGFISSKNGNAK
jgi:photosystem II stability/assembly factor-like uncharacterized protein